MTVAPERTAPLGSVTVPVKSPETSDCAINVGAITAATTSTLRIPVISLFIFIVVLKSPCHLARFYLAFVAQVAHTRPRLPHTLQPKLHSGTRKSGTTLPSLPTMDVSCRLLKHLA